MAVSYYLEPSPVQTYDILLFVLLVPPIKLYVTVFRLEHCDSAITSPILLQLSQSFAAAAVSSQSEMLHWLSLFIIAHLQVSHGLPGLHKIRLYIYRLHFTRNKYIGNWFLHNLSYRPKNRSEHSTLRLLE